MEPVGTKIAASFSKISAARSCRRLTVGSSPYTSSPTSASAIALRIAGVGWVTVSLLKSIVSIVMLAPENIRRMIIPSGIIYQANYTTGPSAGLGRSVCKASVSALRCLVQRGNSHDPGKGTNRERPNTFKFRRHSAKHNAIVGQRPKITHVLHNKDFCAEQ